MTSRRSAGSSERAFSIANGWQRWADAISAGLRASVPFVFHRLSRSPKPIEAAMIWLRRLDNQPAHAWLRDVINPWLAAFGWLNWRLERRNCVAFEVG